MAAADDRLAVCREHERSDRAVVARHCSARGLAPHVVEPHVPTGGADQRLPVWRERERSRSAPARSRSAFRVPVERLPQLPFVAADRVGFRKAQGIAASVICPVGVRTRQGLAVGREGQCADCVAMTFECPDQPAVREVPQPDRLLLPTARERPAAGRERERERRSAVRGQAVPQLAGVNVPDQDKPVAPGRGDELAPGAKATACISAYIAPAASCPSNARTAPPSERSRV